MLEIGDLLFDFNLKEITVKKLPRVSEKKKNRLLTSIETVIDYT